MARRKQMISADEAMASLESNDTLSKLIADDINKKEGHVAYSLGEEDSPTDISGFVSTGCTLLDTIICNDLPEKLGIESSGMPVGRIVEMSGDNQTGKSLIANHILINTQKMGGVPILFDQENGTSPDFLQKMGMKLGEDARKAGLNNLVYLQVNHVQAVFENMERIINKVRELNSDKLITIVWDSIAATPTKEEVEKAYDEATMATKARAISLGLRKIGGLLGKQKVLVVMTNQIRSKFGVMFGDPTTTPGGYSIPHHTSVRLKLYKSGEIKDNKGNVIGAGIRAKVTKNRIGPPGRQCNFILYFSGGVDNLETNFNALVASGFIRKPTTQSYELDYNGQTMKFRTTQWRDNVLSTPGLVEFLDKQVKKDYVLTFGSNDFVVDEETGGAKIEASNEVE